MQAQDRRRRLGAAILISDDDDDDADTCTRSTFSLWSECPCVCVHVTHTASSSSSARRCHATFPLCFQWRTRRVYPLLDATSLFGDSTPRGLFGRRFHATRPPRLEIALRMASPLDNSTLPNLVVWKLYIYRDMETLHGETSSLGDSTPCSLFARRFHSVWSLC